MLLDLLNPWKSVLQDNFWIPPSGLEEQQVSNPALSVPVDFKILLETTGKSFNDSFWYLLFVTHVFVREKNLSVINAN